ncbi:hypothetical protein PsorP6_006560 [Peronosclerospora sorghi]|uniref:Uncharacterized protein n=1 Tax=Peronosclerospora sorghi TaxID=230839 RepID=A0ACC0W6H6_9STRA|nr:hypothetical protein PsorP6_006560 [Peronosclerospora sorghi]
MDGIPIVLATDPRDDGMPSLRLTRAWIRAMTNPAPLPLTRLVWEGSHRVPRTSEEVRLGIDSVWYGQSGSVGSTQASIGLDGPFTLMAQTKYFIQLSQDKFAMSQDSFGYEHDYKSQNMSLSQDPRLSGNEMY